MLGCNGKIIGVDQEYSPVVPATAEFVVPLFDALQKTLAPLTTAIRQELEPQSCSDFMSPSQDILLNTPLHVAPLPSVKQCNQDPHHPDAEQEFVPEYTLPSPVANSQPLQLMDRWWDLSTIV